MKKSKEPVYTGPKKGYCAVFLGEGNYPRIRFIYSNNQAEYVFDSPCNIENVLAGNLTGNVYPCWHLTDETWQSNINRLYQYDRQCGNETIFLGYVKDVE